MANKGRGVFAFGEDDEDEKEEVGKGQLKALAKLVKEYIAFLDKITIAEEQLKKAKKDLDVLIKGRIPEAMIDAGVMNIALEDGTKLKLDKKTVASISEARKDAAMEWLTKNKFGELIKDEHKIILQHSDKKLSQSLKRMLRELRLEPTTKISIHPQTLGALVRSQIEEGNSAFFDSDVRELLGIQEITQAKINLPK